MSQPFEIKTSLYCTLFVFAFLLKSENDSQIHLTETLTLCNDVRGWLRRGCIGSDEVRTASNLPLLSEPFMY